MVKREHDTGTTETSVRSGHGPQTLDQLQATGAEVVGSDGEKVGDLEEVGNADFLVERTLRRDLRLQVSRVGESHRRQQDRPRCAAGEAKGADRKEPLGDAAPGAGRDSYDNLSAMQQLGLIPER
jgi:hypothetical protein